VEALRQAFDATIADPDFVEDSSRSVIEVDGPISGKEVDDPQADLCDAERFDYKA
jgi:hypothetical protein